MATSTRWRLYITATIAGGSCSIGEVEMASVAAGTDLCTGGTPSAASIYSAGYEADKAFDNNLGTRWNNALTLPTWLEYQFSSAVDIIEYRVQGPSDYVGAMPTAWTFEYWDGSSWIAVDARSGQTGWSLSESRTYSASAGVADARLSQLPLEVAILSDTPIQARVSQVVIEVIINTSIIPPTSVEKTDFFIVAS